MKIMRKVSFPWNFRGALGDNPEIVAKIILEADRKPPERTFKNADEVNGGDNVSDR